MQALVGLFLFSILMTRAFSLECETCNVQAPTCTAKNETCSSNVDGCYSLLLEIPDKKPYTSKGCMPKATCEKLKGEKGKEISDTYGNFPKGTVQRVECSKAPIVPASLLLTLSGLLLMKLLF